MYNELENNEAKCAAGYRKLGEKLMFFLIGGGIGAAVALLFAPKAGEELREDIAELASHGYDKALSTARDVKDLTNEFYESAKNRGTDVLEVVSSGATVVKKEFVNDAKKIASIVAGSSDVELFANQESDWGSRPM